MRLFLPTNVTSANIICGIVVVLRVPKNVTGAGAVQFCIGEVEEFCSHKRNQCQYSFSLAGNLNNQIIIHRRRHI